MVHFINTSRSTFKSKWRSFYQAYHLHRQGVTKLQICKCWFLTGRALRKVNGKEDFSNRKPYQSTSGSTFFYFFWTISRSVSSPPKMMFVTYCRTVRLPVVTSWLHHWFRVHAARWTSFTDSSKFVNSSLLRHTEKQLSLCIEYNYHPGH